MNTCNECKFAIFRDHGYSNYTVEGTHFTCAIKKHPGVTDENGFDRFYGEDERLKYALTCAEFSQGDAIQIDVDEDNVKSLTPEQTEIYQENYYLIHVLTGVGT